MKKLIAISSTLLALIIVTIGVVRAGTTNSPSVVAGPTSSNEIPLTKETLKELLNDSWVREGEGGYFIEDAWIAARSPFSLYETHWQLALHPEKKDVLNADSVNRWLRYGLVGDLKSSSLQRIAQIQYSLRIALDLRLTINAEDVVKALEDMRAGNQYGPDLASEGTWGSTAVALEIYSLLGIKTPEDVAASVVTKFDHPGQITTVAALIEDISVINARSLVQPLGTKDRSRIQMRAANSLQALQAIPEANIDASWLGYFYQLNSTLNRVQVAGSPLTETACRHLTGEDGGISIPGKSEIDLQASYYAQALGCRGVTTQVDRPYSRAGWVTYSATESALAPTIAALRIGDAIDSKNLYRNAVLYQLTKRWIPKFETALSVKPATSLAEHHRLRTIGGLLGYTMSLKEPDFGQESYQKIPLAIRVIAADTMRLRSDLIAINEIDLDKINSLNLENVTADQAALLYSWGQRSQRADYTAKAKSVMSALSISSSTYQGGSCSMDAKACKEPSLFASAIGVWIKGGPSNVLSTWQREGLCVELACQMNDGDAATLVRLDLALQGIVGFATGGYPVIL